jgi:hypothetical protein
LLPVLVHASPWTNTRVMASMNTSSPARSRIAFIDPTNSTSRRLSIRSGVQRVLPEQHRTHSSGKYGGLLEAVMLEFSTSQTPMR